MKNCSRLKRRKHAVTLWCNKPLGNSERVYSCCSACIRTVCLHEFTEQSHTCAACLCEHTLSVTAVRIIAWVMRESPYISRSALERFFTETPNTSSWLNLSVNTHRPENHIKLPPLMKKTRESWDIALYFTYIMINLKSNVEQATIPGILNGQLDSSTFSFLSWAEL